MYTYIHTCHMHTFTSANTNRIKFEILPKANQLTAPNMNVDRWGRVHGDKPLHALNRYMLQMKINAQRLGKLLGQRSPVYAHISLIMVK